LQIRIAKTNTNMKKVSITVLSILLLFSEFALAQTTKKTLELAEFKGIYVNSNYTVYLKQTNKQEVIVETTPEILELTNIKVENGILMVNIDRKPDNPNKSVWAKIDDIKLKPVMKITVSVKNINELQVNGGGKIITENSLASDYLNLSVAGNGGMELDLKGNNLKTEISGSGNIILKGYATSNDITMSGSGNLNAFACELESAKVKMSGSGLCELTASANLDAIVQGSGSLKHKGNTKNVSRKIYGSGTIDRAY
jgi:hypothetical protein